jgi:hypothetical protein
MSRPMNPMSRLHWPKRSPQRAPVRSGLLYSACTCGIAPAATCITCHRWQRQHAMVLARRINWKNAA